MPESEKLLPMRLHAKFAFWAPLLSILAFPLLISPPTFSSASESTRQCENKFKGTGLARRSVEQATPTELRTFELMLSGSATRSQMEALIKGHSRSGQIRIRLPESWLARIKIPEGMETASTQLPPGMARYGQEDRPILAQFLAGKPGKPGAVHIFTPGESVGPRDFSAFLGPPHVHDGVGHISVVTEGKGLFYIERFTSSGRVLVAIPVERGSGVVIPPGVLHTFYAGQEGKFNVASFTTKLIPTSSPQFQRLARPATFVGGKPLSLSTVAARMRQISYDDFLRE